MEECGDLLPIEVVGDNGEFIGFVWTGRGRVILDSRSGS